jgi:hypothetical protein
MTKPASPYQTHVVTDGAAFDVDVSAYSVRDKKIIGELAMHYTGKNTEAALAQFAQRVATTFTGWTCAPWRGDVVLDPAAIAQLGAD